MSLLRINMGPCTKYMPVQEPDGHGGQITRWIAGDTFDAAVILEKSAEIDPADQVQAREIYTVTTFRDAGLAYHTVFRRDADGMWFRVTGLLGQTPQGAGLDMAQFAAEKWGLPDG